LIALIIDIHTLGRMLAACLPVKARTLDRCCMRLDMIRKTSLLRKIEPMAMRSSVTNKDHFTTRSSCDERAPKTVRR
jgi:hypothetical protein